MKNKFTLMGVDLQVSWLIFLYLLLASIFISNFFGIPVLGNWEMFTFYHNFAALEAPLSYRIGERANIGGQGYPSLDISRFISDIFGWSINTFRSPAIVAGWFSLCLFFIISKRICGLLPALIAAMFLGVNETFSFHQNQLCVSIITFALCLFVVERIQVIDANSRNRIAIILLGIIIAFSGLHYSLGRFFTLFIMFYFIFKFIYLQNKSLGKTKAIIEFKKMFVLLFISILATFFILSPENLIDLIFIRTFFFPVSSEVQDLSSELIPALLTNLKVYFSTLFYFDSYIQAKNSSELLASAHFTLISPVFLPFVFIGIIKSIKDWRLVNYGTNAPYALIHVLFIITAVPPLFSAISEGETTLSNYRMLNILIPAYFYGAMGIKELLDRHKKYAMAVFIPLYLFQIYLLTYDRVLFADAIKINNIDQPLFNDTKYIKSGKKKKYFMEKGFIRDQVNYRRYAEKIIANNSENNIVLYTVDLNEIAEGSAAANGLQYYQNSNFYSAFISLYISDLGMNIAYAQALDVKSKYKIAGSGYRGKLRSFPAKLDFSDESINYVWPNELSFKLRKTGPGRIEAYLATTSEEKKWLIDYLGSKQINPELVTIALSIK